MIRRPAISPLFPYTTLVRSELEPFGPVQCQQMDAAPVRTRRPEASLQVCDELSGRPNAVVELLRKADETSEIGLAHHRSEEHTPELQARPPPVCRLLLAYTH